MTPKEEAERLIKEFDFRGTPINDALICTDEIIYDYKHYIPNGEKKLKFWEKVKEELEKMHQDNS